MENGDQSKDRFRELGCLRAIEVCSEPETEGADEIAEGSLLSRQPVLGMNREPMPQQNRTFLCLDQPLAPRDSRTIKIDVEIALRA